MPKSIGLIESDKRFVADLRQRHKEAASDCAALLSEILNGTQLNDRARAAHAFGLLGCRSGLRQLIALARDIVPRIKSYEDPEADLLGRLLWAIGRMDSKQSHAFIAQMIRYSTNPHAKGCALDGMAFEDKRYNVRLALQYLSPSEDPEVLRCAMYALKYKYTHKYPKDARRRISPLLKHEDRSVRQYALELLQHSASHRDLVEAMLNDPEEFVRVTATETLRTIDEL